MLDLAKMTWNCHVCWAERPDDKISVAKHQRDVGGVEWTENVRYCNDSERCADLAHEHTHAMLAALRRERVL